MRTTLRTVALAGVLAIGIVPIAASAARAGCGGGGGGYGRAWGGHTFNAGYGAGGPYGSSCGGMAMGQMSSMGGMTMGGMGMAGYGYPAPAGYGVSRGGGPNSPPYYSGAAHSLHGRGFDSARHGR